VSQFYPSDLDVLNLYNVSTVVDGVGSDRSNGHEIISPTEIRFSVCGERLAAVTVEGNVLSVPLSCSAVLIAVVDVEGPIAAP
jgi:hypothetical protein